jgi:predicted Zn finger-like uncharacterized protein
LILSCERCETRFRLDESRLPATGARVRCSRCKHAFFVRPPGTPEAAAIEELAQQAAVTGRPASPDPSWDLEEAAAAGRTMQRSARPATPSETPADFESESDWRFEDEVPQLGDTGASLDLPNGEAPPAVAALDANESSFAELGDPESWDLSASSSEEVTATRVAMMAPVEMPARSASEENVGAVVETLRAPLVEEEPEDDVEAGRASLPLPSVELSSGIRLGGWLGTAALAAGVAVLGLLPRPSAVPGRLDSVSVGPLAVRALEPRLVEHALVGPRWVIAGELHNPGSEARSLGAALGVTLLDEAGAPIEGAVATLPLPPTSLREADPAQLRREADASAAALAMRAIAPGTPVAIEAVFASAPRGAVRFAVTPQPVAVAPVRVEPAVQPMPVRAPVPGLAPAPIESTPSLDSPAPS